MSYALVCVLVAGVDSEQEAIRQVNSYISRTFVGAGRPFAQAATLDTHTPFWEQEEQAVDSEELRYDELPAAAYEISGEGEEDTEPYRLIESKWNETYERYRYHLGRARYLLSQYRDPDIFNNAGGIREMFDRIGLLNDGENYLFLEGYGAVTTPEEYVALIEEETLSESWLVPVVVDRE